MKTFFGTGAWPRKKSVCRPEGREQPRLFEMLFAGEAAFDHMHIGAVAGKFIDQRGAMAAICAAEGTPRDVGRENIGPAPKPGACFLSRDACCGLREGHVMKDEHDHPV